MRSYNCGLVDYIYDTVLRLCQDKEEYQIVIRALKAYLPKTSFKSYYHGLLADLYEMIGDTESQLKTLESDLEYGDDYWRLAQFWLGRKEAEKALNVVKEGLKKGRGRKDELYAFMLDHYKNQKEYERILKLFRSMIKEREISLKLNTHPFYQALWNHYASENDHGGLINLLELRLNNKDIDLNLYQTAESTLTKEKWPEFEKRMIEKLKASIKTETQPYWGTSQSIREVVHLAEIFAYKKDNQRLLETIQNDINLLDTYRKTLMPLFPDTYVEKYKARVDALIASRGRANYRTAATYAESTKKIYQDILKAPEAWEKYIRRLRNENSRLRAMKEEFSSL